MARIRAVIFDVDGTLLDSNDAQAHAWLDALRGHGKNVPFDLVRSKIGMGGDRLVRELAGVDAHSASGRAIVEHRKAILKAHYVPDLAPLPGARSLVERVRARGFAYAVATSSGLDEVADLLRAAAVADLFEVVVSADDVGRSKPSPDVVEVARERLGAEAAETVLLGDTPYDVEAGARAGVHVIAFRSGGFRDRDLAGALAIYDGPGELASKLDQSPLARGAPDEGPRPTMPRPRRAPARGA